MLDFSKQNFIFRRGKIFINDWLQTKPYTVADSVDRYYTSLANRVAELLWINPYSEMLGEEKNDILMASLQLTGWFEDVCSDLGIWSAVNSECQKRYGSLLPFYDMEDYEEGYVNPQDLKLLIWDLAQEKAILRGSIINPENEYLENLADDLCSLFSDEFELAPENDRLYGFIHNPMVTEEYWEARGLVSWFHYRSYIGHRNHTTLKDSMESFKDVSTAYRDGLRYSVAASLSFTDRRNILSLTAPHFLSRVRGDERSVEVFENVSFTEMQPYLFMGFHNDDFLLKDMYSDREITLESNSLDSSQIKKSSFKAGETLITASVLFYNGTYNLCGSMLSGKLDERKRKEIREEKYRMELQSSQQKPHQLFLKASGGETYIVVEDWKAVEDFNRKMIGTGFEETEKMLKNAKNIILYSTPHKGIANIPDCGHCICSPKNKLYDKKKAAKDALGFFVNPDIVPYTLTCILQDDGLLPDAYLNSTKGVEYGRDLLHRNGRFITDYFFQSSREYDLEK